MRRNLTCGVYKITNPIGQIYIGASKQIEVRLVQYKNMHCHLQRRLYESIKKYGWEYHCFEILQTCKKSELHKLEKHYIDIFNSIKLGLNLAYGGGKGFIPNPETIEINRQKNIGRKHTKEAKQKMSAFQKGKIITPDCKKKLRESVLKIRGRRILQSDLDGNPIKEWECTLDVERQLGIFATSISAACRGIRQLTAGGFKWSYIENK